jgi:ligand-binding sensor domain-containing protein/class 3 adenylate cyclase/predicted metal-dependent HD superfamily phosphohydrolase
MNLLRVLLTIILAFLIQAHGVFSQNNSIRFTNLSLRDGLSQSTVNNILQDKNGLMWFCTQDGLNKYDGNTFKVYKHDPEDSTSLSDNFINVLIEDSKGNLWIGAENGLNLMPKNSEKFISFGTKDGLENISVKTIFQDSKGQIFVGTEFGLHVFNPKTKRFSVYKSKDGISFKGYFIQNIYEESGNLWIGSGQGLFKINSDGKTEVFTHKVNDSKTISNNIIKSIIKDIHGKIWVGTANGLNKYDPVTKIFQRYFYKEADLQSLSSNSINFLYEDKAGVLWIATQGGGLNRYEKLSDDFSRFQFHENLAGSLSNNVVFSIYEDRTGTVWIGTNNGISKFDRNKQNFRHYRSIPGSLATSINSNVVWSIFEDNKEILWVGTDEGVNRIDRKTSSVRQFMPLPKNLIDRKKSVYSIYQDHEGVMWFGTDAGLCHFNAENEKFVFYKPASKNDLNLSSARVYNIVEDDKKNLWIGTKEGLYLINSERNKLHLFRNQPGVKESISNNVIRSILQDHNKNIWIGTNGGGLNKVIWHSEDSISFYAFKNREQKGDLSNNIILTINQDEFGFIWIGTYGGGLNKFDPRKEVFVNFTEKNGLSNNVVYSVLADHQNHIWMSTNKGISRLNPKTKRFQNYYENDGLQSNEFNIGSYHKSSKGEMFFGGINGFNAFFPAQISKNVIPPQVVLTDLLIFSKKAIPGEKNSPLSLPLNETAELKLNHKQSVVTFEFAALHYSSPEKNEYAYILEGFEDEWNYVGHRRQATYTNLDPGSYVFRVIASNSDGVWNEEGASIIVTILPPFWKTWWFRIALILLVLGAFATLYKSRIKIIESQKRHLEKLVEERTAEIFQKTRKIEAQKELLEKEKEKVEQLLLNMLPQEMVEELKSKGKASARHYRMASIMFTDFKGFTQIAETIRPKDLVAELDRCFIKFDEIIEKYGLEKIKTIGDSYMCAGGLPIRNKSNPIDVVLAGLEIQRYIEDLKKEKEAKGEKYWELRIGINTGELIAGVVGIKRFAYDIWGDSVNVASRMEMHGEVGKVNITGTTFEHIKEFFDCTYRGKVAAKNKGEVDMYFVDRIKPELSVNGEGIIPNDIFRSKLATSLFYKINYKKAEQFILTKLEDELPDDLYYHAFHHTIDVRDAAERIGKSEGVDGEDMMVLKTAAMYHDAGFTQQYFKNEPFGVAMAKEILPNFGYSPEQIDAIEKMIMATQIPHNPKTLLEQILCDADLDYLGRDDFYPISDSLKKELMARDIVKNDKHWDEMQIKFLESHRYFTEFSRTFRQPEKIKRIKEIKKRYAEDKYPATTELS